MPAKREPIQFGCGHYGDISNLGKICEGCYVETHRQLAAFKDAANDFLAWISPDTMEEGHPARQIADKFIAAARSHREKE